jgi:hypothetical protein
MSEEQATEFPFRPWVRRAGWSIVLVAGFATAAILAALLLSPAARFGWIGERFVWVYIGTLWLGGLKIVLDTRRPVTEIDGQRLVVRPLHQFVTRRIGWEAIRGTEQSGDRLIVWFEAPRGMRFVALNLNLIKGRREFLRQLEEKLVSMGFAERTVERSRYFSPRDSAQAKRGEESPDANGRGI